MFESENARKALASISHAIGQRKGFAVMTGEAGTGKTLLLRYLVEFWRHKGVAFAYFIGPRLSTVDFLRYITFELGIDVARNSKGSLLRALYEFLLAQFKKGHTTVLIIDEAHQMPVSILEEIRVLANFETAQQKLIQIVLVGQPELEKKLDSFELRSLKQRVAVRCHVEPLGPEEIRHYIEHRLGLAGVGPTATPIFPAETITAIYRHSNGIPRVINTICDASLMEACARQLWVVPVDVVNEVVCRFRLEQSASPERRRERTSASEGIESFGAEGSTQVEPAVDVPALKTAQRDGTLDRQQIEGAAPAKIASKSTAEPSTESTTRMRAWLAAAALLVLALVSMRMMLPPKAIRTSSSNLAPPSTPGANPTPAAPNLPSVSEVPGSAVSPFSLGEGAARGSFGANPPKSGTQRGRSIPPMNLSAKAEKPTAKGGQLQPLISPPIGLEGIRLEEPPMNPAFLTPPPVTAPLIRSVMKPPDFALDHIIKANSSWVTSVAFSADGRRLVSGSWGEAIKLWDVPTGQELRIVGKDQEVQALAFSPDGQWLATENSANSVVLWDAATGRQVRTLPGSKAAGISGKVWVYSIAFSPDGRWLASGVDDRTVRISDVRTGAEIRDLTAARRSVVYAAFSPDGRWLASGDGDKDIELWDVSTGQVARRLSGHKKPVYAVAFSPDGRWLASASADKTVKLWDVTTGQEVRTLVGHTDVVSSVRFSADGYWLASGSWDNTVKIWNVDTGSLVQTLSTRNQRIYTVSFDSAGRWLAAGSEAGMIDLWRFDRAATLK